MISILHSLRDCGWAAWLCVLIGLAGTLAGLVGVVLGAFRKRGPASFLGVVAIALGLLAVGTGMGGRVLAESKVESVLVGAAINPSMKERIRAEGMAEASQCVVIGGFTGALPFLLGAVAMAIGLALQKKPAS